MSGVWESSIAFLFVGEGRGVGETGVVCAMVWNYLYDLWVVGDGVCSNTSKLKHYRIHHVKPCWMRSLMRSDVVESECTITLDACKTNRQLVGSTCYLVCSRSGWWWWWVGVRVFFYWRIGVMTHIINNYSFGFWKHRRTEGNENFGGRFGSRSNRCDWQLGKGGERFGALNKRGSWGVRGFG